MDLGEVLREVKSLRDTVRLQERRIKALEAQVDELEVKRRAREDDDEIVLDGDSQEEEEENGQLV